MRNGYRHDYTEENLDFRARRWKGLFFALRSAFYQCRTQTFNKKMALDSKQDWFQPIRKSSVPNEAELYILNLIRVGFQTL